MLKNGHAVSALQRSLLNTIPPNSALGSGTQTSVWDWRERGAIQPITSTSTSLELFLNPYEFGEAIYCDIQHLMNHATEHRARLASGISLRNDPSPSWTFVTTYYWALFLSLTISRLQNKTIIFLDKGSVQAISQGASGKPLGGGVFRISLGDFETTSRRKAELSKSRNSHFHETVWNDIYSLALTFVNDLEISSKTRKLSEHELLDLRAFRCFTAVRFREPHAWQSDLRNAINYRHGFSYRSITKDNNIDLSQLISKPNQVSFEKLITDCEDVVSELKEIRDPLESPGTATVLVMYQALILDFYCRAVMKSFCDIRGVMQDLKKERTEFLASYYEEGKSNLLLPLIEC